MDDQQVREIAEAAFRAHFGDIGVCRINIRHGFDFDDDPPVVDVHIFYDDNDGELTGRGYNNVASEVHDKTWLAGKDDLGYPYVNLIAKSSLGQRDPATVRCVGGALMTDRSATAA